MTSLTCTIGTDVAHLVVFHPDDLTHRGGDPIAWYGYDFAYRKESAAGSLIAFGTGNDGGYAVRLTTEGLAPQEADHACSGWVFPYRVRHGRVLVDNTDALPGQERMTDPATLSDRWFDIADGAYRVTVHPIDRAAAADASDLPDYVIAFERVEDLGDIPVADTPPQLHPSRDWTPVPGRSMETEAIFAWPSGVPDGNAFAALKADPGTVILPNRSIRLSVDHAMAEMAYPSDRKKRERLKDVVLAPALETGKLAVLTWVNGLSRGRDRTATMSFSGRHLVRITASAAGPDFPRVRIAPVPKPDMDVDVARVAALRAQLLRAAGETAQAGARGTIPAFERERLESLASAEAVTTWALLHLDMPSGTRLDLYASSAERRIDAIARYLDDGRWPTMSQGVGEKVGGWLRRLRGR